jgi:abortive infection bacteriophage resistance protein
VLSSYYKPYLSVEEQIQLLEQRGMIMPSDRDRAANWLRRIGYYRLSGYWYPFRVRENEVALDAFQPKTTLERVFNLYVFDKRLRLLMLDAIERVEVGLRVDVGTLRKNSPSIFEVNTVANSPSGLQLSFGTLGFFRKYSVDSMTNTYSH